MKILHHREDLRSVGFIVTLLGLMALQWAGVFRHPAMYVVTLVLAFLACIVNHNHQHCLTFVPAWLNRIFGMLISCCMGQPATAIVPMHNRNHHVHNNSPEDFVRSSLVSFRWNLLNLIAFPVVALLRYSRAKSGEIRKWKSVSHAFIGRWCGSGGCFTRWR